MVDEFFRIDHNTMTAVRRGKRDIIKTFSVHPWSEDTARKLLVAALDKEEAYLDRVEVD
jgi:hypothetical protein